MNTCSTGTWLLGDRNVRIFHHLVCNLLSLSTIPHYLGVIVQPACHSGKRLANRWQTARVCSIRILCACPDTTAPVSEKSLVLALGKISETVSSWLIKVCWAPGHSLVSSGASIPRGLQNAFGALASIDTHDLLHVLAHDVLRRNWLLLHKAFSLVRVMNRICRLEFWCFFHHSQLWIG